MAKAEASVEEPVSKIERGELQERNGAGSEKSGELLFWETGDALDFQSQLQAHGSISGCPQAALALPLARCRAR